MGSPHQLPATFVVALALALLRQPCTSKNVQVLQGPGEERRKEQAADATGELPETAGGPGAGLRWRIALKEVLR